MTSTPPGWYDDGHGARRWWDGVRWTEHVEPAAVAVDAPAAAGDEEPADQALAQAEPAVALAEAPVVPTADAPVFPPADTSVFPPAGEPAYPPAPGPQKKSKLWIVWVVLGVVVLGLVIGGVVAVTTLVGGLTAGGSGGDTSDPDEQAALAAVGLWDEAWDEVDCDKFFEATTEDFRSEIQLGDCAAFEDQAQFFSDSTDEYEVEVNSVVRDGDTIVVTTTETYLSSVDEQGEPIDTPESVTEEWQYYVIAVDGGWAIDDAGTQEQ